MIDMTTMQLQSQPFSETFRRHGYSFKEAAMLTIGLGVLIHLLRVTFGDDFAMQHVVTSTTDKILVVPMTYAGVTGILLLAQQRVRFANKRHRALFTGSVVYIAGSVLSYFLLMVVYPAFLTLFAELQYKN